MGVGPARARELAQKGARIISRRYNALTMASRMLYAGFEGESGALNSLFGPGPARSTFKT